MTFEDAVANVDYERVAWEGLTSAIESDKTVMALECVKAAVDEYTKNKELDLRIGEACVIEIVKHVAIKKLISDKNSPFAKYLHDNLKKSDHSKTEFLRHICIVFNCHSDTALEIMRIIPAEIIDAMGDSWEDIEKIVNSDKK